MWIKLLSLRTALTAGCAEGPIDQWRKRHIKAVWRSAYGDDCLFCEKRMYFGKKGALRNDGATIDHIDSLVLGGRNLVSNAQVICKLCNNLKGGEESKYGTYAGLKEA